MFQLTLSDQRLLEIQQEVEQKMINLYYKCTWKPKIGDRVTEIFYPENGVGTIVDIIRDDLSTTALVSWGASTKEEREYIETRHLSLVID